MQMKLLRNTNSAKVRASTPISFKSSRCHVTLPFLLKVHVTPTVRKESLQESSLTQFNLKVLPSGGYRGPPPDLMHFVRGCTLLQAGWRWIGGMVSKGGF